MNRIALLAAAALLACTGMAEPPSNDWSRVAGPTPGPSRSIGFYAHGCLAGGVELPPDGDGYEAIRLGRRRNYGHSETVDFVKALGHATHAAGLPPFLVGDMAQARGGPLPFGHASHQIGLDVDIWFTFETAPKRLAAIGEEASLPSMLLPGMAGPDQRRFGPSQLKLLRLAAADPRVERIFVNPVIKQALCRGYGGRRDAALLHVLSPWWGHDDHFHVRLFCPADSPDCESQPPPPPGDGCDAGLAHWAAHPQLPPTTGTPQPPRPRLPAACTALLARP